MAELRDVPSAVLREFSTRRTQLLAYMADRGTAGFYAATVAQVETRERKQALDLPRLRETGAPAPPSTASDGRNERAPPPGLAEEAHAA